MKVSIKEVATRLGCTTDFAREMIAQGKIAGATYIKRRYRREFYVNRDIFDKNYPK